MKMPGKQSRNRSRSAGISLIEVMLSAAIFTVGMVGVLSLFIAAVATTKAADDLAIARQKAREAMESVVAARNSADYSWPAIQNTGAGGIFVSDETDLTVPDIHGFYNTSATGTIETITLPNGSTRQLNGFRRQITIAKTNDEGLRTVTITIKYPMASGRLGVYTLNGSISEWN